MLQICQRRGWEFRSPQNSVNVVYGCPLCSSSIRKHPPSKCFCGREVILDILDYSAVEFIWNLDAHHTKYTLLAVYAYYTFYAPLNLRQSCGKKKKTFKSDKGGTNKKKFRDMPLPVVSLNWFMYSHFTGFQIRSHELAILSRILSNDLLTLFLNVKCIA